MPFVDINGYEILILIVIAVIVLGPDKLPEYAAKMGQGVRNLRGYAEGAKVQLREQMGPDFDDIDWKQYDVRQYDPRRIVREALLDDDPGNDDLFGRGAHTALEDSGDDDAARFMHPQQGSNERFDPSYTPYDIEAT